MGMLMRAMGEDFGRLDDLIKSSVGKKERYIEILARDFGGQRTLMDTVEVHGRSSRKKEKGYDGSKTRTNTVTSFVENTKVLLDCSFHGAS